MRIDRFVVCLENKGYSASLELRKIYPVVDAYENDPEGYIRIIDESDEDYLYPEDWFEVVKLDNKLEMRLLESLPA
jgi:hypothetical protein